MASISDRTNIREKQGNVVIGPNLNFVWQGNELKERTDTTPIQHLENTGINSTEGDPDTEESIKFQVNFISFQL